MTYRRICENVPIRNSALKSAGQWWTHSPVWTGIAQDPEDLNRTKRQRQDRFALFPWARLSIFSCPQTPRIPLVLRPSGLDWKLLYGLSCSLVCRRQIVGHGPPKWREPIPLLFFHESCCFCFSGGPYHKRWGADRKSAEVVGAPRAIASLVLDLVRADGFLCQTMCLAHLILKITTKYYLALQIRKQRHSKIKNLHCPPTPLATHPSPQPTSPPTAKPPN